MGMPRQERWLWETFDQLQTGVAITAGALVDHAAGRVRRPPRWVANLGVEWLVRLVREPRRLWRRYLLGLPALASTCSVMPLGTSLPEWRKRGDGRGTPQTGKWVWKDDE